MNYFKSVLDSVLIDFKRNKIRTSLTSLGIMIGVMAVILLTALVLGLKNYISGQFQGLGANVMVIFPGAGATPNFSSVAGSVKFDEQDFRTLSRERDFDYVVPIYITNTRIHTDNDDRTGTIAGSTHEFDDLFNSKFITGEFFDKSDVVASSKVGLMGEALASDFYGDPAEALGEVVTINSVRIEIIGVLENVGNPERDNAVMIPYTTTFETVNPSRDFFLIYLGVEDEDKFNDAKERAEEIMLRRYDDDQFSIVEPSDLLESLNAIFLAINAVLVTIASISLLVGGIGIMNIMYANVTERTKEIGIRRAVGATKNDILAQFVIESVLVSLFGGVAGLLTSGVVVIVARFFFPIEMNIVSVIIAIGVSSGIGVVFGVFPARRAANLTPIDAIRYE